MEARNLISNNQVFIPQHTLFLCCNTLNKPTEMSKDCLENMISWDYKSKFVELDDINNGVEYYSTPLLMSSNSLMIYPHQYSTPLLMSYPHQRW